MQTYSVQQLAAVARAFVCHESMTRQLAFTTADAEYVSFGYVQDSAVVLVHLFPDGTADVLEAGESSPTGRTAVSEICLAIVHEWASRQFEYESARTAYEKLTGRPLHKVTA